jgi:hypothetical protein
MRSQYTQTLLLLLIFILSSCSVDTTPISSPVLTETSEPLLTNANQSTLATTAASAAPTVTSTPPLALGELTAFYRLRIELITSSDWTTLELLNPDNVLTIRQMNTQWAPSGSATEFATLSLSQPLSAAETSTRIAMTADYAITPQALEQPLNFLLQKGALNSSKVRIYNLVGDTVSLLLEVDHQEPVANNPDTNPLAFSLDLSRLSAVPPREGASRRADLEPMVWAFYYPWYSLDDWDSDQLVDHPAEPYASSSPQAITRHIEQAQAAGIDGFIVSWWGPGTQTDRNLVTLLDLAEERDFKVAIYFETLVNGIEREENQIFAWVAHAIRTYGSHPAYMRIDGKPLIVLWATNAVTYRDWVVVSNALYIQGLEAALLGMGYCSPNLELFDGYHDYAVFSYPDLFQTYAWAARMARYYPLLMDNPESKIFAATVQPGYDDRLLPDRGGGQVQGRLDGDTYRATFEAALASDPDWIFITSWNEWWETTQIEPSQAYGDLYLQITREYVDRWKGEQEQ